MSFRGISSGPRVSFAIALALPLLALLPASPALAQSPELQLVEFPGGFLESATTGLVRPRLLSTLLATLLPARGPFIFPLPYQTGGVRITNATDCGGAGDCVYPAGYSYWRNMNNHVGRDEMLIFMGMNRSRGGAGPTLFSYNKKTDQVANLGPLFDANSGRSWHSGEGWYWSGTQATKIYMDDGPRMLRYDVMTRQTETVFDVRAAYGADKVIWQMHSSDDDRVHSVTLRSTPSYEMLGCLVYHEDSARFSFFPKIGDFNECHVDKSGRWLVSLEDVDGRYDLEMRIFDLETGDERLVWDQDGAVGHADTGHGYVFGSDNWNSLPNAVLVWDFARNPLSGFMVSHNTDWRAPAPNHVTHGNARAGVPPSAQYACGSGASRSDAIWGNEIICFRLDGSLQVLVVAPVMTSLDASGGGDDYSKMPKGNLDVTGQYFLWTSNMGGSRLDAFIVKVPATRLMGPAPDLSPPAITGIQATGITTSAVTVNWTTDELSDTQVEFGPTTVYGTMTSLAGAPVTAHIQSLAGLPAGSAVHYRVRSRDAAGNLATSADQTVTTAAAPAPPSSGGGKKRPVGHWKLSEGFGLTAADASGNGRNGTLQNGAGWTVGMLGSALALDGVDDYVDVPHAAALDSYPLSVSFWVKTSATGLHGVINKYLPASMNGWQIFVNGGNLCAWYFRDAANHTWDGTSCTLATPGLADNRWHHVVLVIDAMGARFHVDGTFKARRAWTGTPGPATTTQNLSIGRYPGIAAPHLPGSLDDVRVYDRALSLLEIATLHNPNLGLVGAWRLDEGSGTAATDASGNARTGTLQNGAGWTAGMLGSALALDGVDDYVDVPHAAALDSYPLSVSFWVKTSATGLHGVINKYLPASMNGWQIFVNGGNLCAWYFRDAANHTWDGTSCTLATPGLADNRWHHVVLVVDPQGGRLYADGVAGGVRAWTGTPGAATTTQNLGLGRYPGITAPHLPGGLADVRIFSRALGDEDVAFLRDAGSGSL